MRVTPPESLEIELEPKRLRAEEPAGSEQHEDERGAMVIDNLVPCYHYEKFAVPFIRNIYITRKDQKALERERTVPYDS